MKIVIEVPDEIIPVLHKVVEETMMTINCLAYDVNGGGWETPERAALAIKAHDWFWGGDFEEQIAEFVASQEKNISSESNSP